LPVYSTGRGDPVDGTHWRNDWWAWELVHNVKRSIVSIVHLLPEHSSVLPTRGRLVDNCKVTTSIYVKREGMMSDNARESITRRKLETEMALGQWPCLYLRRHPRARLTRWIIRSSSLSAHSLHQRSSSRNASFVGSLFSWENLA
jgi:hypothetical protein